MKTVKGVGHCIVCGISYSYNREERSNVCNVCECSIPTVCSCGCGELLLNPDNRGRCRKFIYGHNNKNGNHPRLGVVQSSDEVIRRTKAMLKHFRNKEPTCLEKELYEFLNCHDVVYESQKQFGRTIVDAFISNINLAIYADGRYWHDKPEIMARDKRNNDRLQNRGIEVLRLSSVDNGYHLDMELLKRRLMRDN